MWIPEMFLNTEFSEMEKSVTECHSFGSRSSAKNFKKQN